MVKKENQVYLFIGQDPFSRDLRLKKLREEFLDKDTEDFNLDILYGRELALKGLQERLLCLPVKAKKRIIVIKGAQFLKEDIRDFMLGYALKPRKDIVLVLYIDRYEPKDGFISALSRHAEVLRFKEEAPLDAFTLGRQMGFKKADASLRVLNQLLKNGEKPEKILGGLRYSLMRASDNRFEVRRRLKLLLNCDIDIKTGRLKPAFALEKLVINLCCFGAGNPR